MMPRTQWESDFQLQFMDYTQEREPSIVYTLQGYFRDQRKNYVSKNDVNVPEGTSFPPNMGDFSQ